jgi:hypothetical protein
VVGKPVQKRKETAMYRRRNNTQNNNKTQAIQNRNQHAKQENKSEKNITKYKKAVPLVLTN